MVPTIKRSSFKTSSTWMISTWNFLLVAALATTMLIAAPAAAQTGSISGVAWDDADGDGLRDAGESGIQYVQLEIYAAGQSTPLMYRLTDASGAYDFPSLPADDYTVVVDPMTVPGGYTQTFDPDGAAPSNEAQYTLTAGQTIAGVDFGYIGPGEMSGTIWDDADGDGVRDAGEGGIEYVIVGLFIEDPQSGSTVQLMNRMTGPDGTFLFPSLPPDDYRVVIEPGTVPQGYTQTFDPDGVAPGDEAEYVLAPGQTITGIDFGYIGPGEISGTIWDDADGDGVRDAGEGGLEYVNVDLFVEDPQGGPPIQLIHRMTGADGTYLFPSLPPDDYLVVVEAATVPENTVQTFDPDGAAPGNEGVVQLAPGQVVADYDYGYGPAPLWDGLIGYWPLDETGGTHVPDISTSSQHGTTVGNPSWDQGTLGGGLLFDGSGDAITFAYDADFATPAEITLSAWARHTTGGGWRSIIDVRDSTNDGYDLYINPAGKAFFRVNDLTMEGETDLQDQEWHHLVGVYDGAKMILYVDGVRDVFPVTAGVQTINVANPLRIGENYALNNSFYSGILDEVRIYDRGLPREDVEALFVFGGGVLPPPPDLQAGLAAHWEFDEGAGAIAADASGNLPDATVSGASWTTGPIGGALSFDGTDDYVEADSSTALETPAAVTIAAWIKHPTASGWHSIVDKRDSGQDGYDLYLNGASRLYARVDGGTLTGSIVADDAWHHVAMTYDGDVLSLYVDGELDVSTTIGAQSIDVDADVLLGENWARNNSYFGGSMDDVRIYERALTETEVQELFDLGL